MNKIVAVIVFMMVPLFVNNCASIVNGTTQKIEIASYPAGAKIYVDDQRVGVTPTYRNLSRGSEHDVRIELPGYKTKNLRIRQDISGWVIGNLFFGWILGFAIDAVSGGMFNLTPEQISTELSRNTVAGRSVSLNNDMIYIAVTLNPDPTWTPIDRLEPK